MQRPAGRLHYPTTTYLLSANGASTLPTEILSTLALGFLIGLTGALAPGPTLVATINASLAGTGRPVSRSRLGISSSRPGSSS